MKKLVLLIVLLTSISFAQFSVFGSPTKSAFAVYMEARNNTWTGTQIWSAAGTFNGTVSFNAACSLNATTTFIINPSIRNSDPYLQISDSDGYAVWRIRTAGGTFSLYQASAGVEAISIDQTTKNIYIGASTAIDTQSPDLIITGDADSDGTAFTTEAMTISLTSNATPTSATWGFASTQGAGYTFDRAYNFFTDTSSVDDSWGFVTTGITALTTGLSIFVQIAVVNTDGATLQINALGAKAVHKNHNVALVTGDVEVGQILHLVYDGTDFQLLSQLAQ